MPKEKKLADLTPEEEVAWNFAWEFYTNEGWTDDEAGREAWKDLQAEFPRLREFEGATAKSPDEPEWYPGSVVNKLRPGVIVPK